MNLLKKECLLFIDSLGSGGAQRQLLTLACELRERGYKVSVAVYHKENFFEDEIGSCEINLYRLKKSNGFSVSLLANLLTLIRELKPTVVISFLEAPNIYAALAKLISPGLFKLIVSERNSAAHRYSALKRLIFSAMYLIADSVVANSQFEGTRLRDYPWLKSKTVVIHNGYRLSTDLLMFPETYRYGADARFLVIGRVCPQKNPVNLIKGLILFADQWGFCPRVDWAGRVDFETTSRGWDYELFGLIESNTIVSSSFSWLGERKDIWTLFRQTDAVIHVSLYEGLPNVVCEGFFCGKPAIVSDVCDNPLLIGMDERGFMCDPTEPETIKSAIERFIALTVDDRKNMTKACTSYARTYLNSARMTDAYVALL